jgi:predicted lipid carrier protein YhbT/chorismate mutase
MPPTIRVGRRAIDLLDGGMRRLLRLRKSLVRGVAHGKRLHGLPSTDAEREADMRDRARIDCERLGLEGDSGEALLSLALASCRDVPDSDVQSLSPTAHLLRRLLPPPRRVAPLLRLIPPSLHRAGVHFLVNRALSEPLALAQLTPLHGRRVAVEASDLGTRSVLRLDANGIQVLSNDTEAEATIRGTFKDLLLLAARLEDADTLFFQRRLQLTGDVELGLTARNLLDRMPWESIPLPMRIGLHHVARLVRGEHGSRRTQ